MAGLAFVLAIGAANLGLIVVGDPAPETALLTLPEPVDQVPDATITTATVGDPTEGGFAGENGDVQIVYGDDSAALPEQPQLPLPGANDGERLISPGGPKIITIRDPAAVDVGQPLELAHLPEDSALEDTEFGALPVRTPQGRRPMDIYARPWSGAQGKRIALVIGGLGLSQTGTDRAIKALPPEITLAFAPTGNSLQRWMRAAREKGHEILVQVPMEPFGYPEINPGPRTLRLASSTETNIENLHWALGRLTNYTGVMNYMGARFAGNEQAMAPVLSDLAERGLLFFNDGSAGGQQLARSASTRGVPYVGGHIVIDNSQDRAAIAERLKALEDLASAQGYAVGSGSALELTVEAVGEWANEAKKRGFELVGIAALAQQSR